MERSIHIENNGRLFFAPSSCGVITTKILTLKNMSALHLKTKIIIPQTYDKEIKFIFDSEYFSPHETKKILVEFNPIKRKNYKIKCRLIVFDENDVELEKKTKDILIFGEGGDAKLELIPKKLDFKMVKINFSKKQKIILHNPSNYSMYVVFSLNHEKKIFNMKSSTTLISTSNGNMTKKIKNDEDTQQLLGNIREDKSLYHNSVPNNFDLKSSVKKNNIYSENLEYEKRKDKSSKSQIKINNENQLKSKQNTENPPIITFNTTKIKTNLSHLEQSNHNNIGQIKEEIKSIENTEVKESQIFNFFTLDFTEGVIPAKSKKEINITFCPKNICELSLRLEVYSRQIVEDEFFSNNSNLLLMGSSVISDKPMGHKIEQNENKNLLKSCLMKKKNLNKLSKIEQSELYNSKLSNFRQNISENILEEGYSVQKKDTVFRLGYVLKTHAIIKVKAHYPLIRFVNIKNNILSVSSLWEKFQISKLNKELSKPLTDFEKKNHLNNNFLFDETKDDKAISRKFIWDFGYVHNSKEKTPRKIITHIQNFGGTDLEWRIKMENDTIFPLQTNNKYKSHQNNWRNICEQEHLFEIFPKNGILKPNEKQKIVLLYHPCLNDESYEKNGEKRIEETHNMKAYLTITNGKSVEITMIGKTISSIIGKLVMKTNQITLPRIPTNLVLPIVVPVILLNIGSNSVKYYIDKKEFFKSNQIDKEMKEISLENTEGTLASMEKKNLLIKFKPREEKVYKFKVNLKVFDFFKEIQNIQLTLNGNGCNKNSISLTRMKSTKSNSIMSDSKNMSKVKKNEDKMFVRKSKFNQYEGNADMTMIDYDFFRSKDYNYIDCIQEDVEVFFTCEELEFIGIEPMKNYYKFIYLCNKSEYNISFDFKSVASIYIKEDTFKMYPMSGNLLPNELIEINFELMQTGLPSFYEIEIPCNITYKKRTSNIKLKNEPIKQELIFLRIRKAPNLNHFSKIYSPEFKQKNPVSLEPEYQNISIDIGKETFKKALSEIISTKSIQKIIKSMNEQPILFYINLDDDNDFIEEQKRKRKYIEEKKTLKFSINKDFKGVKVDSSLFGKNNSINTEVLDQNSENILSPDLSELFFSETKEYEIPVLDKQDVVFKERKKFSHHDFYDSCFSQVDLDLAEELELMQTDIEALMDVPDPEYSQEDDKEYSVEELSLHESDQSDDDEEKNNLDENQQSNNNDDTESDHQDNIPLSDNDMDLNEEDNKIEESILEQSIDFPTTLEKEYKCKILNKNINFSIFESQLSIFTKIFQNFLKEILEHSVKEKLELRYKSKKVQYWLKSVVRDKLKRVNI